VSSCLFQYANLGGRKPSATHIVQFGLHLQQLLQERISGCAILVPGLEFLHLDVVVVDPASRSVCAFYNLSGEPLVEMSTSSIAQASTSKTGHYNEAGQAVSDEVVRDCIWLLHSLHVRRIAEVAARDFGK
jgi:hypothetical protein